MKTKTPKIQKPSYTIKIGTSYGYNLVGEYPSKAAAKRAIAALRETTYPFACMKVVAKEW